MIIAKHGVATFELRRISLGIALFGQGRFDFVKRLEDGGIDFVEKEFEVGDKCERDEEKKQDEAEWRDDVVPGVEGFLECVVFV